MDDPPQWQKVLKESQEEEIKAELVEDRGLTYNHKTASTFFKNGFFGKPVGVRKPEPKDYERIFSYSMFEILYLYEKRILVLKKRNKKLSKKEIKKVGQRNYSDFSAKYLVYKDLREKGWVVRPGLKYGADFSIYKYGPHLEHAPLLINVFSKDKELLGIDFVRSGRLATSVKKKWALALVFNDNVEYLTFKWHRP